MMTTRHEPDLLRKSVNAVANSTDLDDLLHRLSETKSVLGEAETRDTHFAKQYRTFLGELLRVLAGKWVVLFSESERKEYFDFFFDDRSGVQEIYRFIGLCAGMKAHYQEFRKAPRQKLEDNPKLKWALSCTCDEFARLFQGLFSKEEIIRRMVVQGDEIGLDSHIVNEFINSLMSVPDLVYGSIDDPKRVPKCFQRGEFATLVVRSVFVKQTPILSRRMIGLFASKLVRTGSGQRFGELLTQTKEQVSYDWLIDLDEPLTIESIVLLLIRGGELNFRHKEQFATLLRTLCPLERIKESGVLRNLCCRKLLLSKPMKARIGLFALLDHLRQDRKLFLETALHVANVWCDPAFVNGTDFELHEYVTGVLFCIFHRFTKEDMESSGFRTIIVTGMQGYLDSGVPDVRKLGMVIAQIFSQTLDPSNPLQFSELGPSFHFKYDETLQVQLVQEQEHEQAKKQEEEAGREEQIEEVESGPMVVPFCVPDDEDDFSEKPVAKTRKSIWDDDDEEEEGLEDHSDESDSDDEESLQPLDQQSHDDSDVKPPSYMRDALDMLRKEDRFDVQAALSSIAQLIASDPPDLTFLAKEVADTLLHLQNRFAFDDFVSWKASALAAVTAKSPEDVAPYLCSQVLADNMFTSTRLEALQALSDAATMLSNGSEGAIEEETRVKDDVKRVGTVTKVWGRPKRPSKKPQVNRFGNVAPHFFFPLLVEPNKSLQLFEREPFVLARILITLGNLCVEAKSSIHIQKMSTSLLPLVTFARTHDDPQVRRANLYTVAQLISSMPQSILQQDLEWLTTLQDLKSWVETVKTSDPDQLCRAQAELLFKAFGGQD